jgi:hypothetical protein
MTDIQEVAKKRAVLEAALQDYIRSTRDLPNMFVQDYVIIAASESMEPGHENVTYFNNINRLAMPIYSVLGLLESARGYYRKASGAND